MEIRYIILISILKENKIRKLSKIVFKALAFILLSILSKKVLKALYWGIGRGNYTFLFNLRLLFLIFILYLILREDNVYLGGIFMGFNFRKSLNLGKGLKLNISKSGIGLSLGTKGIRVSSGPKGNKLTLSIPGTGISYTKTIKSNSKKEESVNNFVYLSSLDY